VKKFCHGHQESIECFGEDKNRIFIMELFLHCADISNPYKPHDICARWADLVSQEFFSQGDKERAAGIDVSPMMDRDSSNLFNMQMGFIEFVVSPLINSKLSILCNVFVVLTCVNRRCDTISSSKGDGRNDAQQLCVVGQQENQRDPHCGGWIYPREAGRGSEEAGGKSPKFQGQNGFPRQHYRCQTQTLSRQHNICRKALAWSSLCKLSRH
jgi:hypothetical protein